MSSSRSIAAARNRRAGDSGLQAKGPSKQPVTSINSHRAFTQNNDSVANNNDSSTSKKGLPFSKLTVSDAIGLITLRLGKVEQYLIDTQNNEINNTSNNYNSGIDNCVLTTIINRLDALEKKDINHALHEETIKNINREISTLKQSIQLIKKNTENIQSTVTNKFNDIELAFVELEKNIDALQQLNNVEVDENVVINNEDSDKNVTTDTIDDTKENDDESDGSDETDDDDVEDVENKTV